MSANPFIDEEEAQPAAPAVEDSSPGIGPGLIDGQWRPGNWKGFEMLTCVMCQWDTLEGIEAARTKKASCPRCAPPAPAAAPAPSPVVVADRWGNPITTDREN